MLPDGRYCQRRRDRLGRPDLSRSACRPRSGTRRRRHGRGGRPSDRPRVPLDGAPASRRPRARGGRRPSAGRREHKQLNGEIYSPPYSSRASRPRSPMRRRRSTGAARFTVSTPDAARSNGGAGPDARGHARDRREPALRPAQLHRRERAADRAGADEQRRRASRLLHALVLDRQRRPFGRFDIERFRRSEQDTQPPTAPTTSRRPAARVRRPHLVGVELTTSGRELQRLPLDDANFTPWSGEPGRPDGVDELHRHGPRRRHLLLRGQRPGRGGQPRAASTKPAPR